MTASPFPGMDPFLEAHWPDVQLSLVMGARDALNRVLPDDLAARADERDEVQSEPDETAGAIDLQGVPQHEIAEESASTLRDSSKDSPPDAPVRTVLYSEPATERVLQIAEWATDRLVTVVEFVSP